MATRNHTQAAIQTGSQTAAPSTTAAGDVRAVAVLASLAITRLGLVREDERVTDTVRDAFGTSPEMGTYRKRLVDASEGIVREIAAINREAIRLHKLHTVPWGDVGQRMLPTRNYWAYRRALDAQIALLDDARARFQRQWDDLVDRAREQLGALFSASEYTDARSAADRWSISYAIEGLPAVDPRITLDGDARRAIEREIEERISSKVADAQRDTIGRLRETIAHLAERLAAYRVTEDGKHESRLHGTALAAVVEMADMVPALNVAGDPAIERWASAVKAAVQSTSVDVLRADGAARGTLARQVEGVLDEMAAVLGPLPS